MKLYLTTDAKPNKFGLYRCLIWTLMPTQRRGPTSSDPILWVGRGDQKPATLPRLAERDLTRYGFPPPGEMREVDIGPCEEGE